MKRFVTLAILGSFFVAAYFAIKMLPWWALVLALVAFAVGAKFLLGRIFRALIVMPFRAKGAVLRGATARVNSVTPTGDTEITGARARYQLDVTITPLNPTGNFTCWEPGELSLIKPETKVDVDNASGDDACQIESVEVEQDGQFQADEGMKFPGPQRVKLNIAVAPGVNALKFQYYFEEFGEVLLPPRMVKAA